MQTVVVTGAAGALGQRVVRLLADRDDVGRVVAVDVVSLADPPASVELHVVDLAQGPERPGAGGARSGVEGPERPERPGAGASTPRAGDCADELDALLSDADAVVHLAWRVPKRNGAEAARVADANQRALRRVLGAAEATAIPALVHLSSATVYGAWPDNTIPLPEEAMLRPNPGFGFAVGKAEAERLLAEWAENHPGVRVAVLRPTVTVGSGHSENGALYEALGGTRGPSSGEDPARPVQFLHVDDLASAVVHAWEQRLTGVFNVAPDRGIGEDTARSLAGGVAKVPLPERLARAVAIWSWDLWRRGVPRDALPYARWPWVIAPDKLAATGWKPAYSSEAALVVTDPRPHWDDLPPMRRQGFTLLLAAGGVAGIVGGAVAAVAGMRRRAVGRKRPLMRAEALRIRLKRATAAGRRP